MRHLVVVSDLHLWQATDHDDLWMRYRDRRFLPDAQLASMLDGLCKRIPSGQLTLVLNGDTFDFDLPPVTDGHTVQGRSPRTEDQAVERLDAILRDHEDFLQSLAALLLRGHRVVFIAGNHDIQLNFPRVRQLLFGQIVQRCMQMESDCEESALRSRLAFHPWFYRSPSGVHVEHGNQYDLYCSVSDPLWPFRLDRSLQSNVGTLVLEHLIGKLGYFNPNVEKTFLLTTKEYLTHWQRYYFRKPRSLLQTFFVGAWRIFFELWGELGLVGRTIRTPALQAPDTAAHYSLFATADLRATMRLLRLDRLLLVVGVLWSALALLVFYPLGIACVLLTMLLYEVLQPRCSYALDDVAQDVAKTARRIAAIYGCKAVVFGHTHDAAGSWEHGVFYGNSGTWVPRYHDVACSVALEESRPFIWLREAGGALEGGLYRYRSGAIQQVTASCADHITESEDLAATDGAAIPDASATKLATSAGCERSTRCAADLALASHDDALGLSQSVTHRNRYSFPS